MMRGLLRAINGPLDDCGPTSTDHGWPLIFELRVLDISLAIVFRINYSQRKQMAASSTFHVVCHPDTPMHAFANLYVVAGLVHDGHFANGRTRCSALCAIKHRPHVPSPMAQNPPSRTFHAHSFPCFQLKMRSQWVLPGRLQAPCRR